MVVFLYFVDYMGKKYRGKHLVELCGRNDSNNTKDRGYY